MYGIESHLIGFTGTRSGMTPAQLWAVSQFMVGYGQAELHHGCCVGADEEAVTVAVLLTPKWRIVGHPSNVPLSRSAPAFALCDELAFEAEPLRRNREIVRTVGLLLAAPRGPEVVRSGTWATIRYAHKIGRRTLIFWPDGSIETRHGAG